jgi:asparaginyl-tRNA synthetase
VLTCRIGNGAAVEVIGTVVKSQGKKQACEIQVKSIQLVGDCDATSYPLQKKRHRYGLVLHVVRNDGLTRKYCDYTCSLEYLRSISHLRARTNTIGAGTIRASLI